MPVTPIAAPPLPALERSKAASPSDAAARKAAESFEASFLAEMLQYTGINSQPESFGGGAGEEAFGSLLTEQYAKLLAARGDFGIAERIFDILKEGTPET